MRDRSLKPLRRALFKLRDAKNALLTLIWMCVDTVVLLCPASRDREKSGLALIRTDMLGDYILFRNYLPLIRHDPRYAKMKITLIGNSANRQLAENYDGSCVDQMLWVDRNKLITNIFYRLSILHRIRKSGFEEVFYPTYSREYVAGDAFVRVAGASKNYGCVATTPLMTEWQNKLSGRIYNRPILTSPGVKFEFLRNKEIVGIFLDIETRSDVRYSLPIERGSSGSVYAVISPGVGGKKRIFPSQKQWDPNKFLEVARAMNRNHGIQIIIVGTSDQLEISKIIEDGMPSGSCINLVGKTTQVEAALVVGGARIVVSNDTAACHIAAAAGAPFVCVSNGLKMGQFTDYPASIAKCARFVYPPAVPKAQIERHKIYENYSASSILNIDDIEAADVVQEVEELLRISKK